jgi:hypothetical protein
MGFKIQTASARCSELEDLGLIQKLYNPNNSFSWFRYVEDPKEREELRKEIANKKKYNYFAKGFEMGYFKWGDDGQMIADFKLIM